MQVLFAKNRDKALDLPDALKLYWKSIEQTFEMFLLNLYVLVEITKISEEDDKTRKSKYLPNDDDRKFLPKLYSNPIITNIVQNKKLQAKFKSLGFAESIDNDIIQKIYSYFSKEEAYINFWSKETQLEDDVEILLELYRFCRSIDFFNELMEDHFYMWNSEKSIVIGSIKKVLKDKENAEDFYMEYYPEKVTTKEFGENLMILTDKNETMLDEMIVPNLKNWDKDRVTILDMILIKMAITEFLNFETIPPKVTLNEYVELSKSFSTEKSKEFVNGVLDKILKELEEEGKVKKIEKD